MDDPLAPADAPPGSDRTPGEEKPKAPPKPKGAKAAAASIRAEAKEIESKLAALLARPGIPMRMAGDEWPAEHVETNAPGLASAVARRCEEDAKLREQLLRLLRVGDSAGLVIAALMYLVPVLLYYGVVPAPPIVNAQLGVPVRAEVRGISVVEQARREAEAEARVRAAAESVASAHAADPQGPPENTVAAQAGPLPPEYPPPA